MRTIKTQTLVIGGGIFGSHTAHVMGKSQKVILVEQNSELISEASQYNQTRVHTGAHYPRAPHTALKARNNLQRFQDEFKSAINSDFQHIYAIAKDNSLTDEKSFERFLNWLEIKFEKYEPSTLLGSSRIKNSYLIKEGCFDPLALREYYSRKLKNENVEVLLAARVIEGSLIDGEYHTIVIKDSECFKIISKSLVNATYSKLNEINNLYKVPSLPVRLEKARLIFLSIPSLKNKAITIMDGPFLSLTPYGQSGLHILTSVIYTHQRINPGDYEGRSSNVEFNKVNDKLILNQMENYLPNLGPYYTQGAKTIVKTTLETQDERDERPTVVYEFNDFPNFYAILAGKVSSIYEVEEYFANEL